MMLPQSGQGGASSSGRKANMERDGSLAAAPTEPWPPGPGDVPRGEGVVPVGPVVTTRLVAVGPLTGPETRLIGTGRGPVPGSGEEAPPDAPGPEEADAPLPCTLSSSFTCTPIARCWSLARNLDASHRKM